MLPRERRLTNTRDYKRVYQKGLFFSVGLFKVTALPNKTNLSRVGIVVNKKVAPKAVQRNLIKRLLREAVNHLYVKIPNGYDLIISAKESAAKASLAEIEKVMDEAIGKLK